MLVFIGLSFIVLSLLVLVHEFGHFLAAKKSGVLVEEFGLGLPPRIWGKKIGETLYSINLLPIGGFVRLHGEEGNGKVPFPERAFVNKGKATRAFIAFAGILVNFLFAIFCFSFVYSIQGIPQEIDTGVVKIIGVSQNSPALDAGFIAGDIVKTVAKKEITTNEDFIKIIDENKGKKTEITVLRDNQDKKIVVTPRADPPENQGPLGVVISSKEIKFTFPEKVWQRPLVGTAYGIKKTFTASGQMLTGLGQIFSKAANTRAVPNDVVGIVGIVAITGFFLQNLDPLSIIEFIGAFSLNLAIFNLLPFPPLDGFKIFGIAIEKITGKKLKSSWEEKITLVGFGLLVTLMIFLSFREVIKIIQIGSIKGFVESVLK